MSSSWSFQAVCSLVRHVMYDIGIGPFFFLPSKSTSKWVHYQTDTRYQYHYWCIPNSNSSRYTQRPILPTRIYGTLSKYNCCHWFLALSWFFKITYLLLGNHTKQTVEISEFSNNAEEAMALFWQFLMEAVMECGCEMRWLSWVSACISSWLIHLNKCQRKI